MLLLIKEYTNNLNEIFENLESKEILVRISNELLRLRNEIEEKLEKNEGDKEDIDMEEVDEDNIDDDNDQEVI